MSKQIKNSFLVYAEPEKRTFSLRGRYVLILQQMIEAGPRGITALELKSWTTRLANVIGEFRNKHLLDIETVMEANTGQFGGEHGRYVLRTLVTVLPSGVQQEDA